ncbi:MAG: hypothetical protein HKN87_16265 [Saprospiraceae bacterium]|nr:hypothetical protein [Saprospiraceae bacterium]
MFSNLKKPVKVGMLLIGCIVLVAFVFPPGTFQNLQPQAIAPYLNGIFPMLTPGTGSGEGNWTVVDAYPQLTFTDPVAMVQIPGGNGFYICGKSGYVWKVSNDSTTSIKDVALDISAVIHTDGDAGVTNMILHPEFGISSSPHRGYMYMMYRYHPVGSSLMDCEDDAFTRVSRFTKPDGVDTFDLASELVLVQQFDPHCWHAGGAMFFDTQGFFYFAMGDIGGIDDRFNSSQRIDSAFFGGLHRIDVDQDLTRSHPIVRRPKDPPNMLADSSYTQGYLIPNDNPFTDSTAVLEEFFALGLRSPHRGWHDEQDGQIWIADVGEGAREEISVVEAGDNLQWPFREGSIDGPKPAPSPLIGNSKGPVYDYPRSAGNSVIGGFVYRGIRFNGALEGKFIFGDHATRNIWSYNPESQEATFLASVPGGGVGSKNGISSFAADSIGNIYVLKLFGTNQDGGRIYKLHPGPMVPDPPTLLSQTGAFSNLGSLTPAPGIFPYQVILPLWSDGATKKTWIAIPNDGIHDSSNEQITFSENGTWGFPEGTVIIKHFDLPIDHLQPTQLRRLETRFIVLKEGGGTYGVTYKWNGQQTDAILLTGSDTSNVSVKQTDGSTLNQIWTYPSRTDCQTCHNENAGGVLGVNTPQLNNTFNYSGMSINQLLAWQQIGLFSNPFDSGELVNFPKHADIDDQMAGLESRVRSYLDVNCAHCHRPNGVQGAFDARSSTPLDMQGLILQPGIGVNTPVGQVIVKPKEPDQSALWLRDHIVGNSAMPPLAKSIVDTAYIMVLTDWINSLEDTTCSIFYLSDLPFTGTNGWGPVELDRSNGSSSGGDGTLQTINGVQYRKGLGTHPHQHPDSMTNLNFDLNQMYALFQTSIGIDDSTCSNGDAVFSISLDDSMVYESPVLSHGDAAIYVELMVTGKMSLRLEVQEADGDITCDHANWAEARLIKACDDGDACTINDRIHNDCLCAGTLKDENNDGICDDLCPETLVVQPPLVSGYYQAYESLILGVPVEPSAHIHLRSANAVELVDSFTILQGSTMEIKIEDCQ